MTGYADTSDELALSCSAEWSDEWRRALAAAVVAGDWSPAGIARFGGISRDEANRAFEVALTAGAIDAEGQSVDDEELVLLACLTEHERRQVHAHAARHLALLGPDHHGAVLQHIRAAGPQMATGEAVELLDRLGELSLSIGAYADAAALLGHADSLDAPPDPHRTGQRLCRLAAAVDGTGRVDEARQHLARAVSLGTLAGDHDLVARAAVDYALPVDWYAGDERAAGFLKRAAESPLSPARRVQVSAARALVEMRLPVWETGGQQVAWVTRPGVAQPLADEAVAASHHLDDPTRLLALLAWRGTHRAPEFLERRLDVSMEAFTLAQRLRHPAFQVDAGVWLAVDAAEHYDRITYDRTVAIVRWIAERDGNPRLRWRALTLIAGQALLDGDVDGADAARSEAATLAGVAHLPGWTASDMFMAAQRIVRLDDPDGLTLITSLSSEPVMQNPIALAVVAYAHARVGDHDIARHLCRRALTRLDAESSLLFTATRLAATAIELRDDTLMARSIELLTPYREHWSVDSNGWWHDGPVDGWLALLHEAADHGNVARSHARRAITIAQAMGDQRTLTCLGGLADTAQAEGTTTPWPPVLTARQRDVLDLVARGLTNAQIAEALHFSVSTIRQTLATLYDVFGTRSRAGLVAGARADGLT